MFPSLSDKVSIYYHSNLLASLVFWVVSLVTRVFFDVTFTCPVLYYRPLLYLVCAGIVALCEFQTTFFDLRHIVSLQALSLCRTHSSQFKIEAGKGDQKSMKERPSAHKNCSKWFQATARTTRSRKELGVQWSYLKWKTWFSYSRSTRLAKAAAHHFYWSFYSE